MPILFCKSMAPLDSLGGVVDNGNAGLNDNAIQSVHVALVFSLCYFSQPSVVLACHLAGFL